MSKFLIIRFSSIGDIVLTTPVVRCIKNSDSNNIVHYLTKKSFETILKPNPNIDMVFSIQQHISEIADELKVENYDYIIDLHNNLRSATVKLLLKKRIFSFNKLNFRKWMLVKTKLNYLPNIHIVDRYMETLKPLNILNDGKGLDFFIDEKTEIILPPSHQKSYVAFVIGGAHATKKMTTEKLISICKKITKPILLIGGKEDIKVSQEICKSCGENIFNACGIFSLQQSALALKNAEMVITHDTGMMHIAAAFNKKIISVWGNTVPEFGMYPYLLGAEKSAKNIVVEVKHLKCRPCSKIGYDTCPKKHFNCMNMIDENEIIKNVN